MNYPSVLYRPSDNVKFIYIGCGYYQSRGIHSYKYEQLIKLNFRKTPFT